ncbi:MAG: cytidylate kinase [Flavobacteriaceae bacterium]|nr:cytidylate kinase [Flavobacteriaceae bacterium]MAJ37679.1 cytidylate kinase [Flavobacteriaceae bacterium]
MTKKIIIAIDGHASTGKSTLAKTLAQQLNYVYIDSGAMYRAVTLFAVKNNLNAEQIIDHLDEISISFDVSGQVFLNEENVSEEIRGMRISERVSEFAAIAPIRHKMIQIQQGYGKDKGVVMDGRDIGTAVFPEAELKLFMSASPEIRAKRRFEELKLNQDVSYEEVLKNILDRDEKDSSRKINPLRKATDALVIDNSHQSKEEMLQYALKLVEKALN